jgi:hypothetical protein
MFCCPECRDGDECVCFWLDEDKQMDEDKQPSRQLIKATPLTADNWKMIMSVAPAMAAANMFGVNEAAAMAIMLKGHEIGFGLAASFEYIHVIKGKPSLSPRGALAILYNHPEFEGINVLEETGEGEWEGEVYSCTVTIRRKEFGTQTTQFTMRDALRANLVKPNSGWESYPANMLRWRAIGYCIDLIFPDIGGGMKRSDEYGADLTQDGEVIEGSWSEVNSWVNPRKRAAQKAEAEQEAEADNRLAEAGAIVEALGDLGLDWKDDSIRVKAICDGMGVIEPIASALNTALRAAEGVGS